MLARSSGYLCVAIRLTKKKVIQRTIFHKPRGIASPSAKMCSIAKLRITVANSTSSVLEDVRVWRNGEVPNEQSKEEG